MENSVKEFRIIQADDNNYGITEVEFDGDKIINCLPFECGMLSFMISIDALKYSYKLIGEAFEKPIINIKELSNTVDLYKKLYS